MIVEMSNMEYAVCQAFYEDEGYSDGEILDKLINLFGVETRVTNSRDIKSKFIKEGIAS